MTNQPIGYWELGGRLGSIRLRQRLALQVEHAARVFGQGRTLLHIENAEWLMVVLYWMLRLTGVYGIGHRNFADVRLVRTRLEIEGLEPAFDGFRILHLSDLHIDLDPGLTEVLIALVTGVECDVCVITGDFRAHTSGPYDQAVAATARLAAAIAPPVVAVLGNHDFLEMVPPLEEAGVRFLLNEAMSLDRDGARLHLVGVDDPHFYQADNLERAMDGLADREVKVLLCHSPELYREAEACGIELMLCGHTHAGQVCLPGRVPLMTNARCPRRLRAGAWLYRSMAGYTSPGTGSCGVRVRFFCPPEITLHELCTAGAAHPVPPFASRGGAARWSLAG